VDFVIHIIFRFNDSGQIVEEWDAFDNLGFLSQIGETQFLANPVAEVMLYPEVVDVGMSEQNREVVGLYFDALNQGNLDFITTSFKSDFVAHNPFGKLDRTGLINDLSRLRAALPDLNVSVQQLITEGNWTAVIYVLNGSFTQPYSLPDGTDVPATGNTITLPIITFFRFEQQGLVAEFFEIYDSFAFLIQLGLLPLGPSGS
jgi:predicted ester cyclase